MDKCFGWRGSKLCAQQTFRCRDDERFDEVALHLAAQHMEILGCGSRIADLNIVLSARLQKSLQPRAEDNIQVCNPTTAAQYRSEDTRLNSSHQIISYAVFCLKK